MMSLKSKFTWAIVALALAAVVTRTTAINCAGNGKTATALTATSAAELCPDYASDPRVKSKHAWVDSVTGKGGHCGGTNTEELQRSIANGLFGGGNTAGTRDCTAWCVQNSEGKGHFKFNPGRKCFKFRGTGMCGNKAEKQFAKDAKAQLCVATDLGIDDATCRDMDSSFSYPILATLSNDYEVSYSVKLNSIKNNNAFLVAKGPTNIYGVPGRTAYWNNYLKPGYSSSHTQNGQLCLDAFGESYAFTEAMNIGQQYEFSFQYQDKVVNASRCSNGANCISETNMAVTYQMYAPHTQVTFVLNNDLRGADGTLCNLQVRDFRP